jgi:hypothetical protein
MFNFLIANAIGLILSAAAAVFMIIFGTVRAVRKKIGFRYSVAAFLIAAALLICAAVMPRGTFYSVTQGENQSFRQVFRTEKEYESYVSDLQKQDVDYQGEKVRITPNRQIGCGIFFLALGAGSALCVRIRRKHGGGQTSEKK